MKFIKKLDKIFRVEESEVLLANFEEYRAQLQTQLDKIDAEIAEMKAL